MRHHYVSVFPSMLGETLAAWDYAGIRVISVVKGGIVNGQYAHIAFSLIGYGPSPEPGKPAPETVVDVPDYRVTAVAPGSGLKVSPPSSPVRRKGHK